MTTFLKGLLIGIAETIPGVSGGTIALITGIYSRLIKSLQCLKKQFIIDLCSLTFKPNLQKAKVFITRYDLIFLSFLGAGSTIAFLSFSFVIPKLIAQYTSWTLSFLLGLLIPLVYATYKKISHKQKFLFCLLGVVIFVFSHHFLNQKIQLFSNQENYQIKLIIFFFAGVLAICALLLPGISGSYVLLCLGLYFPIIDNLQNFILNFLSFSNISSLVKCFILNLAFISGCIVGAFLFLQFINAVLKKYYNQTISLLVGCIIGSFYPLFPFKSSPGKNFIFSPNIIPSWGYDLWVSFLYFAAAILIAKILTNKQK